MEVSLDHSQMESIRGVNYPLVDVSIEHLTRGHEEIWRPFMAEISTIAPVHPHKRGLSVTKISVESDLCLL